MTSGASIAVVQLDADGRTPTSRAQAREQALTAVRRAAEAGCAVVVLPEYASGWTTRLVPELAEPEDGPFLTSLASLAAEVGVSVVAGVVLPAGEARGRNVAVVIGPDGSIVGRYTKTHLYDAYGTRESDLLDAGDPTGDGAPLVLSVPFGAGALRLGVATCYDLRFPESFRALVDAPGGPPDVVAVGAAWAAGPGKAAQLRVLARARAIENTCYLALASQGGYGRVGGSVVVDPRGVVVGQVGDGDDDGATSAVVLASAVIAPEVLAQVRAVSPVLAHRRYGVHPRR